MVEVMPVTIGNNVRLYREHRGESLGSLGQAVGIDPSRLSRIERGLSTATPKQMLRFAYHFDVAIEALFFEQRVAQKAR